jgi:PAS domain S-box-containing protein
MDCRGTPMENWSVQRKTLAAFIAALTVLFAIILASFFTTESHLTSSRSVSQSFEVIAAQERVYSDLIDLMWNQRAYVVSGNPADLAARTAARDRLVEVSASLPTLPFASSPDQLERIVILRGLIADELAILDEALGTRGLADTTPERRIALREGGRGLLIKIRAILDEIESVERLRVERHNDEIRNAAHRLYAAIGIVTAVFLVTLGWLLKRIFADLEARDVVDDKLHEANAFLESLLENIPTMIFVKDAKELRFVRFNRAGELLLGYPRKDLIGKNDRDFFPPDQADFFINKDRQVLAHGKVTDIPEEEIDTLLQGRRILHTSKVPIYDAEGNPSMLLGISMDITEQKISEREVIKLNTELKQKAELLLAANQELESFCYSVSHDLRAPLRAIDGYAGIFEMDYGDKLDGNAKRLLHGIRNNSRHMAELIDDLLEFSRLGRQALDVATVDMTTLAKQAAEEIAEGTSTAPVISIQPLTNAKGDARALYHVWLNLLDNAVKYSRRTEKPVVTAWAEKTNNEVVYSVRDNGVGFDMQYYEKLFGVFERLHSSKEYPGTGVGLAIVKRVVVRHGGRVWAESKPGEGATFHFTLPMS